MEKTFTVAGYSVRLGVKKLRVANSMDRVKVLVRAGHKDIVLQELPYPMTKEQAQQFLTTGFTAESQQDLFAGNTASEDTVQAASEAAAPEAAEPAQSVEAAVESAAPAMTLEEALAQVPVREKGRFLKREVREERARELMAA
jgi:hypothetical protein